MEILFHLLGCLKGLGIAASISTGMAAIIFYIMGCCEDDEKMKKGAKFCMVAFLLAVPFACIPTISDLWTVRISLIKYQLAAPQNVSKGIAKIEEIGRKLECKYLGCEEEK